jgi:hypothetical protein
MFESLCEFPAMPFDMNILFIVGPQKKLTFDL